jgi:glycerol-3-phosphate responsive antiterminator
MGYRIDVERVYQRLVTLDVHHDLVVGQRQAFSRFSQTVAPTGVISTGHHSFHAVIRASLHDFFTIGRDHHLPRLRELSALRNPHHHRDTS